MNIAFGIAKFALLALAVVSVARPLFKQATYGTFKEVWSRVSLLRMVPAALTLWALVLSTGYLLSTYVPLMGYGWADLFFAGGGNISLAPVMDQEHSSYQLVRLLVPLFFLGFIAAVPSFAKTEEEWFRKGHTAWPDISWQSLKFGLVHCIVGIPLGYGFAFTLAGLFFGYIYKSSYENSVPDEFTARASSIFDAKDNAVLASTAYHTVYNTVIMLFLAAVTLRAAVT